MGLGQSELREGYRRRSKISEQGETAQCHVGGNRQCVAALRVNAAANTVRLQGVSKLTQAIPRRALSQIVRS